MYALFRSIGSDDDEDEVEDLELEPPIPLPSTEEFIGKFYSKTLTGFSIVGVH